MCGKPNRAKLRADPCDNFYRRRLNIVKRVVEFEFLPFESSHLMEGQDIDSLHVSQISRKLRNLAPRSQGRLKVQERARSAAK